MEDILFLDIETIPLAEKLDLLSDDLRKYWLEKAQKIGQEQSELNDEDFFRERGAIFSEFGKIVCISVGVLFKNEKGEQALKIKSFANDDEKIILENFKQLVEKFFTTLHHTFCGHNIKEFDIPYICRRMIINGIKLPKQLQFQNKKPWEMQLLDTMDFWRFGDYKRYTSLKLLTAVLNIPTPKDDIDGSQVAMVYYNEKNLQRIVTYCEKDVVATVQVWLRLNSKPIIAKENILLAE
ncbi:MAG: 3'-5' exonuclease [Paludibacter sp.]|nr:MAG: 3'-5' exonuclease [Paludibacter sp.]